MRSPISSYGLPLFIAAACLAVPAAAQDFVEPDQCDLSLQSDSSVDWSGLYGRGYEVFEADEHFEVIMVEVRHAGPACEFFIVAETPGGFPQPSLIGAGGNLQFDLRRDPSGPSVFSADFLGDQISRLSGVFNNGVQSISTVLYLTVPTGQTVGGGTYSAQPTLRLFRQDAGGTTLMDQVSIDVNVPVRSVLSVELADAAPGSRTMDVNLGNLSQPVDQSVVLIARSNAPITAKVNSQNGGVLEHFAGAPGIPYSLSLGGNELDLSNQEALVNISNTRLLSESLSLNIRTNGNANSAAGQYSDTITLTFVVD